MKTRTSLLVFAVLSALLLSSNRASADAANTEIDIPFTKFVLTNGLTVIVHEDHKAPIVAVDLWYHVGSKNEKPGKTGFAHLFEHLMFTGSEHFRGNGSGDQRTFFEAMERIGATDLNGTTSEDRTDFFENVPRNALDVALWIESDRMGYLLGSIDQKRLDTQRGVVQNEKRQDENQPYAVADELITKGTAPAGHPYSWTVIGSMDDLNAASLDDVKRWFTNYYGPANVTLALVGDIDPATARAKAEQYFGNIPPGPPTAHYQTWIPQIGGTRREKVSDHVALARLYKTWNVPPYGDPDAVYLALAADTLSSSSKSSRLYKRLVYDDQTATEVSASLNDAEIRSQFQIQVTAQPGADMAKIEKAADEEVARFLAEGPTAEELQRVKAGQIAAFVRGAERVGGFGGKADLLAENQTYRGDPAYYKTMLKYIRKAKAEDLQNAAKRWLTDDVYILEVDPFPNYQTTASDADRSSVPKPGPQPEIKFPAFQRATLSNGLKIVLAERHSLPLIDFKMLLDAGFAADQSAQPGACKLTMRMLNEGTAQRTALQISDQLLSLGASLGEYSRPDYCQLTLSTLPATADAALDIYSDVLLNATFPDADFQREHKRMLAEIKQEKDEPFGMALRVLPKLLFGPNHAYGSPLTGSGTEESVSKLTRADLQKFHDAWFKPNHATLVIVGDTTLSDITPKLEKAFAAWQPGEIPVKNIASVERPAKSAIYLIDKPDADQSVILTGEPSFPKADPDSISVDTMNVVLGGAFTSRLNMNLREDKHWSYGAGSFRYDTRGQGPYVAYAQVQMDKTAESLVEINKELHGILGQPPISADELSKAQQNETLSLPGNWETIGSISGSLADIVNFGLPDDYNSTYMDKVRALTVDDLTKAAQKSIHPDQLVWVVVGDRAKIEAPIRKLNWGEVHLLDADGNPIAK